MSRLVPFVLALVLAGCGSVQTPPPRTLERAGEVGEAAVGGRMVNDTSTTVTVTPLTQKPRVDGVRVEFVYLGPAGSDPGGRNTIRVRYAEHKIANGVENEIPEYWAEVTLDLSRTRTIEFKGWRIGVLEATDSAIRYEVVGRPVP